MAIVPNQNYNWVIYKITNPNGRAYIGITSNFKKRISVYKSNPKTRQTAVFASLRKYGYDNHSVDVIDEFVSDISYANGKELFWIRSYMSNKKKYPQQNGMNLSDGAGGTLGRPQSAETKEKLRKIKSGKLLTEKHKQNISTGLIGKARNGGFTEEQRAHLREVNSKYRHTEEAKRKIGEASKGNKYRAGQKRTEEEKKYLSELNKGKKLTQSQYKAHCQRVAKACGKPVIQYDVWNNFIKEFPMITTAANEIGIPMIGVHRNLKGKTKQYRGFVFKYK